MAWVSQFLLGRPGNELTFDVNPNMLEIKPAQVAAKNRTLSGRLKKWVFRTSFPTITLQSSWFTLQDYNAMQSLLTVSDTMLSFRVRNGDLQTTLEIAYPTGAQTVPLRENSALLLSTAIVAAGGSSTIAISGVFDNPAGMGTNYYSGGSSYTDASFTLNLNTPLNVLAPVYVTYTYPGWLVSMDELGAQFIGGQVDLGKVSGWTLEGV